MLHVTMAMKCVALVLLLTFVAPTFARNIQEQLADEIEKLESMGKYLSAKLYENEVKDNSQSSKNNDKEELPSPVKDDTEELPSPVKDEEGELAPVKDENEELVPLNNEDLENVAVESLADEKQKSKKAKKKQNNIQTTNSEDDIDDRDQDKDSVLQGGDELLTPEQKANETWDNDPKNEVSSDAIRQVAFHWKKKDGFVTIPINLTKDIEDDWKKTDALYKAIDNFESKSCIRFSLHPSPSEYHIRIINGGGCYSFIGNVGGDGRPYQDLSIGKNCGHAGIIQHEMLHALGFFHEQSRPDRDTYVKVNWDNIKPQGAKSNFDKQTADMIDTQGMPYDFDSIMHYGSDYFAWRGTRTLERLDDVDGGYIEANRKGFSVTDLHQLNCMYKCEKYTNLAECDKNTATKPVGPGGPVKPRPTPKPTPKPNQACEGFAQLGLCSYKEICNLCKPQCLSPGLNILLKNLDTDVKCEEYRDYSLCNNGQEHYEYMMQSCFKTCFFHKYPEDGMCQ